MNLFKKLLPDVVVIVLFALISFAYFYPAVNEGRILAQHDAVAGIGSGRARSVERYKQVLGEQWEELPPMFRSSSEKRTGREEILDFIGKCLTEC